ncbi:MAG TPA: DUF4397 domain-containing protein, partial [Xanthomonadales bacterium]|nr:DUF4397 domain-containing protein [Xanthomonadales bacterium]
FADSLDGTAVNIVINGNTTFENVRFTDFVQYTELPAGVYEIDIVPVGATEPAMSATFTLNDGVDYSVFAIGNGSTQPLELTALVDDNSAPAAGNAKIRVVHAAPFAADLAATEVSIRTAGGDVVGGLVGVPYKANSGYLEIPAGTYDLKVASNDGGVNYIDPLPADIPAGAILTLFAVGDGINQDLGILAYPLGLLGLRDPVDNSANGWWGVQEGSGVGFILQPVASENRLVGTWYSYDNQGDPVFYTFDSDPAGFDGIIAETTLYRSTGGGTASGKQVLTEPVGTVDFEIVSCFDAIAVVRIGQSAAELYTAKRLVAPLGCSLE